MKECMYYKKMSNKLVKCELCPNYCTIKNGNVGICKVRKNLNGTLFLLSYGKPIVINVDLLTKKPIYHMLPGTNTFSIGTPGCNLKCLNCQNWMLSQRSAEETKNIEISPKEIIQILI